MDLSNILNITNVNYEEIIKKSINEVKEEYKDLTTTQTCFIYSSLIQEKLKENHIISRIISTNDLGFDYEHRFVLVKELEDYYIIDLTYRQFFNNIPERFNKLDQDGYQKVDEDTLNEYITSIAKEPISNNIGELFFK